MKDKIKPDPIVCFEKYKEKPSFSQNIGKAFRQELYDLVMPINEIMNCRFRYIENGSESRWQADINKITDIFDLSYKVKGSAKEGCTVGLDFATGKPEQVSRYADTQVGMLHVRRILDRLKKKNRPQLLESRRPR